MTSYLTHIFFQFCLFYLRGEIVFGVDWLELFRRFIRRPRFPRQLSLSRKIFLD